MQVSALEDGPTPVVVYDKIHGRRWRVDIRMEISNSARTTMHALSLTFLLFVACPGI